MKRIVSMLIAVLMIANSALAYTTTVRAKGLGIVVTSGVGNTITVTPKTEEIKGWLVEEGNIEIVNNQFVMPEGNVKIKAIESKYLLTIEFPYFTNKEERAVGESITVEALTENEEYTFKNWTATGLILTTEQQTNATLTFTMPTNEVTIVANYEVIPTATTYTVTFDANGGTGTMNNQTFTEGTAQNLTTNPFTKDGYTFAGWSTTQGGAVEYTDGVSYTATADKTLYAVWEPAWNAPTLGEGLTPVNWNGTDWVTTDEANWDYNYEIATAGHGTVAGDGTGKWANAMLDADADGTLESLYVWIPRYTYKIISGEHEDVDSWSNLDIPGTGKIEVKFSQGTTDDTTDSYKKHPAFTFGTDELEGIWVAKYEASTKKATSSSDTGGTAGFSKPGVISYEKGVSACYSYAYNLNRTLESHLIKNSEWGAVAYLTNAVGKIPYINDSNITGNASVNEETYAWNTENGVKASTTHNVYGIYDLNGGRIEFTSAYVANGHDTLSSNANSLVTSYETYGSKYVEVYPTGTSDSASLNYAEWADITGDAVYETSGSYSGATAWDGGLSNTPWSGNPVFRRGGNTAYPGIFGVFKSSGSAFESPGGFRCVLAIP